MPVTYSYLKITTLFGTSGYINNGPFTVSKTTSNPEGGSTTNITYVKFLQNGDMDFDGATVSPPWTKWNNNTGALISPTLRMDKLGIGSTNLRVSTTGAGGFGAVNPTTFYAMDGANGLWLKLEVTGTSSAVDEIDDIPLAFYNNSTSIVTANLNISSAINVSSNPFITPLTLPESKAFEEVGNFATARITIYAWDYSVDSSLAGKIKTEAQTVLGGDVTETLTAWTTGGAGAGTYTVAFTPTGGTIGEGSTTLSSGTLSSGGEVTYELSVTSEAPSGNELSTETGSFTINKDGGDAEVSGTYSLWARSTGTIF
jgi:hypothetical protein